MIRVISKMMVSTRFYEKKGKISENVFKVER